MLRREPGQQQPPKNTKWNIFINLIRASYSHSLHGSGNTRHTSATCVCVCVWGGGMHNQMSHTEDTKASSTQSRFFGETAQVLCVSADRPDGAGESGARNNTFLKPPSEVVSNLFRTYAVSCYDSCGRRRCHGKFVPGAKFVPGTSSVVRYQATDN